MTNRDGMTPAEAQMFANYDHGMDPATLAEDIEDVAYILDHMDGPVQADSVARRLRAVLARHTEGAEA